MTERTILVTGATGNQGRALIRALGQRQQTTTTTPVTDDTKPQFRVLALTRNTASPAAQRLASAYAHVTLVKGDLDDAASVRKIFEDAKSTEDEIKDRHGDGDARGGGGIWGVFCVLAYPGLGANADAEEMQGKMLADLALEYGVAHFVFSSNERGGEYQDDQTKLDSRAKVMIERHVRELGREGKGLGWTILRPGFFMENYNGFLGSITVGVLKAGLKPTTTNRLVAVDDIGEVAAGVFKNPHEYTEKILVVSGEGAHASGGQRGMTVDVLAVTTMSQQGEAYKLATGRPLPAIPALLARAVIAMNAHTRLLLADLERMHHARETGLCPEVVEQNAEALRAHPGMKTLRMWEEAGRGEEDDVEQQKENWNGVSLLRLIAGRL